MCENLEAGSSKGTKCQGHDHCGTTFRIKMSNDVYICCIQSNSNASHFPRQEMAAFPQMFFLQEHYLPWGTSYSKDPSLGLSPLNKTVGKCKSLFFKNDWQYLRAHFVFWSLWQIPNLAACSACPTQLSCWRHVEIDRVAFCNLVMRLTTFTPIA